jgi:membrane-bound lytic murein transglycosylase D
MHFAGMTLTIHADARKDIQKDVDALRSSPRYFNMSVERAKTYFPIIEKIFKEENVPDDLKYLVIQESALVSDAVSTSNAVGYWQFKAETAKQMGLRVDNRIDERMNIVAASRGAAKYFKQSNAYFNNWIYVVQSYQMGIGGTTRAVGEAHLGARHMDIDDDTYWYVKKYLAHKVAFEHALGGAKGQIMVTPVLASGVSLDEISEKSGIEMAKLKDYNKWIRNGEVPDDKEYSVVIPNGDLSDFNALLLTSNKKSNQPAQTTPPIVTFKETEVNGLRAVMAGPGESVTSLAKRANVDLSDFIKWNDVSVDSRVTSGQVFYLERKSKTSSQSTHTAKAGENLWTVSQTYGVRMKTLRHLNDLTSDQLRPGTLIYLSEAPGKVNSNGSPLIELDHNSPFEWGISGKSESDYIIKVSEVISQTETRPSVKSVPVSNQQEHIVAAGETLYTIANQHGLTVASIQRLNGLDSNSSLKPGQVLKLADIEPVETAPNIHEVQAADTIYSIARQYGLSVKQLMDLNSKKDFDLKPGQKLIIR